MDSITHLFLQTAEAAKNGTPRPRLKPGDLPELASEPQLEPVDVFLCEKCLPILKRAESLESESEEPTQFLASASLVDGTPWCFLRMHFQASDDNGKYHSCGLSFTRGEYFGSPALIAAFDREPRWMRLDEPSFSHFVIEITMKFIYDCLRANKYSKAG